MLAVRTGFLLMLAFRSGCFISCEQPGGSVMFQLHIFQVLLSHGSGFQKASKWLHNKNWYLSLEAQCKCPYKGQHFTVQGSFTRAAIDLFNQRCRPNTMSVYGHEPTVGEPVSRFSASYPLPLCEVMAAGSSLAHKSTGHAFLQELVQDQAESLGSCRDTSVRAWFDDPEWVQDICESVEFTELFRYKFRKNGHKNMLGVQGLQVLVEALCQDPFQI